MKPRTRWINLFIRDIFLGIVLMGLHVLTHFKSNVVFLITGMFLVYVIWQFNDFLNYVKLNRLTNE